MGAECGGEAGVASQQEGDDVGESALGKGGEGGCGVAFADAAQEVVVAGVVQSECEPFDDAELSSRHAASKTISGGTR